MHLLIVWQMETSLDCLNANYWVKVLLSWDDNVQAVIKQPRKAEWLFEPMLWNSAFFSSAEGYFIAPSDQASQCSGQLSRALPFLCTAELLHFNRAAKAHPIRCDRPGCPTPPFSSNFHQQQPGKADRACNAIPEAPLTSTLCQAKS